jgi:hypothetical protein
MVGDIAVPQLPLKMLAHVLPCWNCFEPVLFVMSNTLSDPCEYDCKSFCAKLLCYILSFAFTFSFGCSGIIVLI